MSSMRWRKPTGIDLRIDRVPQIVLCLSNTAAECPVEPGSHNGSAAAYLQDEDRRVMIAGRQITSIAGHCPTGTWCYPASMSTAGFMTMSLLLRRLRSDRRVVLTNQGDRHGG